jgi:SpoVK/Ycf46/Vps4 family AAA+-type ATPase
MTPIMMAGAPRPSRHGHPCMQVLTTAPPPPFPPQVHLAPLAMGTGLAADFAKRIAALTPGFSGAELANVCNEAALIAARRNALTVDSSCFDAAIDRVLAGMEKKGLVHGD